MTSYESLHIFKLIKLSIPYNFLTIWNFFLQFSTFFKLRHYQLFPMISVHVKKQCSNPLISPLKFRFIATQRPVNYAGLIGDIPVRIIPTAFISLDNVSIGVTSL